MSKNSSALLKILSVRIVTLAFKDQATPITAQNVYIANMLILTLVIERKVAKALWHQLDFLLKMARKQYSIGAKKCGMIKNNKVAQADDLNALMQIKLF